MDLKEHQIATNGISLRRFGDGASGTVRHGTRWHTAY
jgi:hypothetical protein